MTSRARHAHVVRLVLVMVLMAGAARAAEDPLATPETRQAPTGDVMAGGLPDSILLPTSLVESLERMIQASTTFRSQCDRLARVSGLYIRVRLGRSMDRRSYRARSVIHRTRSGRIIALVEIEQRGSPIEWIAHEFEHVLEQIDGVRLEVLERRKLDVWRSSGDMFETGRAIRAGRAVAAEMRSEIRRDDKYVE